MRTLDFILSTIFGAIAGAGVGLFVGILGTMAGGMAEGALDTTVVSWEMGGLIVPILCTVIGLLEGALGALSRTWVRGLLIGVFVSGLFSAFWLSGSWAFPIGVKVWAVTVWVIAGGAAGLAGGRVGKGFIVKSSDTFENPR